MLGENSSLGKAGFGSKSMECKGLFSLGAFFSSVSAGVIRIRLNLVCCDSCCRLELEFEFVFPETRNMCSFPGVTLGEKDPHLFLFPLKSSQTVLCALKY